TGTSTACRTGSSSRRSRCGSPAAPWNSSTAASASPATCDRCARAALPRCRSTCPRTTASGASGTQTGSDAGPTGRGLPPPSWSRRSWTLARIPSRATAPASGSCAWAKSTAPSGSKPPAPAPFRPGHSPTGASSRSSCIGWTLHLLLRHPFQRRRSSTPTFAAPSTTRRRRPQKGDPMLLHPTLEKLQALNLTGMLRALQEQLRTPECNQLSFEERLGMLVDCEATERENRRLAVRLGKARLRQQAVMEDVDFRHPRGLDRSLIL